MTAFLQAAVIAALVGAASLAASPAGAAGSSTIAVNLEGEQEVPVISTGAEGDFRARISRDGTEIGYELSYEGLEGNVTQAHLHLGQKGVNGAIVIFLCTNLGNGPAGTQACPPAPATITGTITADDVIEVAAQGIAAGDLDEVLAAIRAGLVYANVHSQPFPAGEIRGQLKRTHRRD
jgi:hypothetical protein